MNIIPMPNNFTQSFGKFTIDLETTINYSSEFVLSSTELLKYVKEKTNLGLEKKDNANINILLNIDLPLEGYIIEVKEAFLNIHARTDQGAFYAVQSLKQLAFFDSGKLSFISCNIEDYPRFSHRSFMLDVARHFFDKEIIFKIIDYLAYYKFNFFHLHLSDDQGFRIQIDKYPKLTSVGSIREKTKNKGKHYNYSIHKGFYSKQDIKEIVEYAKRKFIEVIPEIDFPGHTSAILASYPNLSCNKKIIKVPTRYGILKNTLCVSSLEDENFIKDILDEVIELFPSKYIHIGGDEVRFANWNKCPKCKELKKNENLKNNKQLLRFFINNLASYLREKGKTPIVWNDFLDNKSNYNIILQHWKPFTKNKSIKVINEGRKAIISNFFHLYLDYPYSMTPLKKTYNFKPLFKGILDSENILGVEATLWTEYIHNFDEIQKQILPRLAAVAENAWTNPQNKNYDEFLIRLKKHISIYKENRITYNQDYLKGFSIVKTIKWFYAVKKNAKSEV